jgi:hypothetical protein
MFPKVLHTGSPLFTPGPLTPRITSAETILVTEPAPVAEAKKVPLPSGLSSPKKATRPSKKPRASIPLHMAYPSLAWEIMGLDPPDRLKRILDICRDFGLAGMTKELSAGRKKRLDNVLWPTPNISKNTSPKKAVEYERMAKMKSIGTMHQGMQPNRAYITGSAARMISIDKKASPSDHDVTFEFANFDKFAAAFKLYFGEAFPDMQAPLRSTNFVYSSQAIPGGLHVVIDRRGCHKKVDLVVRFTDERHKWTTTYSDLTSSCRVYFGESIEPYYQVPIPSGTIRLLREANIMHHPDDIEKLLLRMYLARAKYESFLISPGQVQRQLKNLAFEDCVRALVDWGWEASEAYKDAADLDSKEIQKKIIEKRFPLLPPGKLLEIWQKQDPTDADLVSRLLLLELTQYAAKYADPAYRNVFKFILQRECQEPSLAAKSPPALPSAVEQPRVPTPPPIESPEAFLESKARLRSAKKKIPKKKLQKQRQKSEEVIDFSAYLPEATNVEVESKEEFFECVEEEAYQHELHGLAVKSVDAGTQLIATSAEAVQADRKQFLTQRAKMLDALDLLLDAVDKLDQLQRASTKDAKIPLDLNKQDVLRRLHGIFAAPSEQGFAVWGDLKKQQAIRTLAVTTLLSYDISPSEKNLERAWRLYQSLRYANARDFLELPVWLIAEFFARNHHKKRVVKQMSSYDPRPQNNRIADACDQHKYSILDSISAQVDSNERAEAASHLINEIYSSIGATVPGEFKRFTRTYNTWKLFSAVNTMELRNDGKIVPGPDTWEYYEQRAAAGMATLILPRDPKATVLEIVDNLIRAHALFKEKFPTESAIDIGTRMAWMVDQVPLFVVKLPLENQKNLRCLVLGLLSPSDSPKIHEIRRVIHMYKILQTLEGFTVHDSPLRLVAMYCLQLEPKAPPALKAVFDPLWAELQKLLQPELGSEKVRSLAQQVAARLEKAPEKNSFKGFRKFLQITSRLEEPI